MTDSEKLDFIITKVVSIEKKIGLLEKRVDLLEKRMDFAERRLSIAEVALADDRREERVTHAIVENDLNHSIRLIAEGYHDLKKWLPQSYWL